MIMKTNELLNDHSSAIFLLTSDNQVYGYNSSFLLFYKKITKIMIPIITY